MSDLPAVIKKTLVNAMRILTSRQRMERFLRVSLYRNALYLMLNSASLAITGFVFWIIAARIYDAETVGMASAVLSAAGLLSLVAGLGLHYGVIRFLSGSGGDAGALVNSTFTVSGLAAVAASAVFIAGLDVWSPSLSVLRADRLFLAVFVVYVVLNTTITLLTHVFIAHRRAGFTLATNTVFGLLRLPLPIFLFTGMYALGLVAAQEAALAVALVLGVLVLLPRAQPGYRPVPVIRPGVVNRLTRFSLTNYVVSGLDAVPGYILPLLVINLLGAEENAYFYIAWMIALAVSWVPTAVSYSLFAEGSNDASRLSADIRQSIKLTALLLLPVVLVVLLIGDKLLLAFGDVYSQEATRLLWLLVAATIPLSVVRLYYGVKRVQRRMRGVIGLSAAVSVMSLGLSCWLMPGLGITGLGIAWLASQTAAALAAVVMLMRERR